MGHRVLMFFINPSHWEREHAHAICFLPISRSTSGVMMSSIASPIFPARHHCVFMCEINEPCSIASSHG